MLPGSEHSGTPAEIFLLFIVCFSVDTLPRFGYFQNMYRNVIILLFAAILSCTPPEGPAGTIPENQKISRFYNAVISRSGQKYFPGREWQSGSPSPEEFSEAGIRTMESKFFPESGPESEKSRNGVRTDAVLVIRNGRIIYERYNRGYTAETPHLTWSVSKTFAQALIGAAAKEGILNIDDPVSKYLSYFNKPDYDKITLRHFLMMSSGISWVEGYEASPLNSDVINMLYAQGSRDMAAYTASRPIAHPPGEFWYYSSGDTNVLMAVLREAVKRSYPDPDAYSSYPWKKIFEPLGITSAVFEQDAAGTFVGSSYVYLTARDLARFAWLWMNGGKWNNKEILTGQWIEESTRMTESFYKTPYKKDMLEDNPGWQLFLNLGDPGRSIPRPYPDVPEDAMIMSGHWGQTVMVIPSEDTVFIRYGDDRDGSLSRQDVIRLMAEAFPMRSQQTNSLR